LSLRTCRNGYLGASDKNYDISIPFLDPGFIIAKFRRFGEGATEIAGVENVSRAKKQGLKTQEWTSRHEVAGVVDIVRVDNVTRRSKGGLRGSGQGGTKKRVDNAGVSDIEK